MEKIYSEEIRKITRSKKAIEDALSVKLIIEGRIINIDGKPEDEMICLEVIEAINLGFTVAEALDLKQDDFILEKVQIKTISRRHDLSQVRARVIGTKRKAMDNIEYLTDCDIVLHDNTIGIIGKIENVKHASYAIRKLVAGSKHANVYAYLEEQKAKEKASFYQ